MGCGVSQLPAVSEFSEHDEENDMGTLGSEAACDADANANSKSPQTQVHSVASVVSTAETAVTDAAPSAEPTTSNAPHRQEAAPAASQQAKTRRSQLKPLPKGKGKRCARSASPTPAGNALAPPPNAPPAPQREDSRKGILLSGAAAPPTLASPRGLAAAPPADAAPAWRPPEWRPQVPLLPALGLRQQSEIFSHAASDPARGRAASPTLDTHGRTMRLQDEITALHSFGKDTRGTPPVVQRRTSIAGAPRRIAPPPTTFSMSMSSLNNFSMKPELVNYAGENCLTGMVEKSDLENVEDVVEHNEFDFEDLPKLSVPCALGLRSVQVVDGKKFSEFMFPKNKFEMTNSRGKPVKFTLKAKTLNSSGANNAKETITITSSPPNAVTLPDHVRAAASIPLEACFFAFSYPIKASKGRPGGGGGATEEPYTWEDTLKISCAGIKQDDSFRSWLHYGGFVYFDHKYDIVAVNAVSFEPKNKHKFSGAIFLGNASQVTPLALDTLTEYSRWVPLSVEKRGVLEGFTEFCWIHPCEAIGDLIFPKSGGFAYKRGIEPGDESFKRLEKAGTTMCKFFPVVPSSGKLRNSQEWLPLKYVEEIVIKDLDISEIGARGSDDRASKFIGFTPARQLHLAKGTVSAFGMEEFLGVDMDLLCEKRKGGIETIRQEVKDAVNLPRSQKLWFPLMEREDHSNDAEEVRADDSVHLDNMNYVLNEAACVQEVIGNDGLRRARDTGHHGMTLQDFSQHEIAQNCKLSMEEVAALRLYTTSTFRLINECLRNNVKPHPLAGTTFFISQGLKKLRAQHLADAKGFKTHYLWRGMRDLQACNDFMRTGGAETACMSTSQQKSVVARYASSDTPLLFRIRVSSPMDMGADISWLSTFPEEREVLYPPLTYLKPLISQPIKNSKGMVYTVKPSFPT